MNQIKKYLIVGTAGLVFICTTMLSYAQNMAIVYVQTDCPYCEKLVTHLKQNHIPFRIINDDQGCYDIHPVTIINGKLIYGVWK
jgi:hypothetical protein